MQLRRSCGKVGEHIFRLEEQLPQPVFVGSSISLPPLRGPSPTGNTGLSSYDPLMIVTLCIHPALSMMDLLSYSTRAKQWRKRDIQSGYA